MAISVGAYGFDEGTTTVRETLEAVGGRETRAIVISGLIRGAGSVAGLEVMLDEILRSASVESPVYVSVRSGRRILARREQFVREVQRGGQAGRFELTLRAENAWEESDVPTTVPWSIASSGTSLVVESDGNLATRPTITLDALGTILSPELGDGVRTLRYDGVVETGSRWTVDGESERVWLDGVDITPYTEGDFPVVGPGETTLTYSDDPSSSHLLDGTVAFRARWW